MKWLERKMKSKKIIILLAVFCLCVSTSAFAKRYAVIVHPSNPVDSITAGDLGKIYLGEKTTWSDGQQIKVVSLRKGEAHTEFLKDIVKLGALKFATLWKRKIFTGSGTGTHISFVKTDEKVKDYIKSNPFAIGYISINSLDDTVKRIKITD